VLVSESNTCWTPDESLIISVCATI